MKIYCAPFKGCKRDKAQALKPLEEAAEVFGAWQNFNRYAARTTRTEGARAELIYECCDLIQATVNLMFAFGANSVEVYHTLEKVREANEARGREYEAYDE